MELFAGFTFNMFSFYALANDLTDFDFLLFPPQSWLLAIYSMLNILVTTQRNEKLLIYIINHCFREFQEPQK
jgi:hypothetical protein